MDNQTFQILIAMVIYMAIVIVIGILFAKRANQTSAGARSARGSQR